MDSGSKTDPYLVLFEIDRGFERKIGETEVISDSLNPKWVKAIDVDYFFEKQQTFKVKIYDVDD